MKFKNGKVPDAPEPEISAQVPPKSPPVTKELKLREEPAATVLQIVAVVATVAVGALLTMTVVVVAKETQPSTVTIKV